jgi:putative oxidoreductase
MTLLAADTLPTVDELDLGLLILRLVVGPVFAFHGFAKVFRGGRLDGTARWFDSMGMRPGHVHARLAAFGELATGACLALGFLTAIAGLGLVGLMCVAVWTVHRGSGLLVTKNGWEYNLVLGTIGVAVATMGPGEWSVDEVIGLDLNGVAGLLISLVGGVAMAALVLGTSYRPPAATADA